MASIESVAAKFDALAERIASTWYPIVPKNKTFLEHQGWPHVPLTPEDAVLMANEIAERLRHSAADGEATNADAEGYWIAMAAQADLINFNNFNSNPNDVAKSTFDFLMWSALNLPTRPADVDWVKVQNNGYIPRRLANRISGIEARLNNLDPRTENIQAKVAEIEAAHDAAERLPTDMEELRSSKEELKSLLSEANRNAAAISNDFTLAEKTTGEIDALKIQADALIKRCEVAYRITTSAGLAVAFEERSKSLAKAGWFWLSVLVIALVAAVSIGTIRLSGFLALLSIETPQSMVVVNVLAAMVGVGGPIWLAWIATKNIGQSFKLAEDYAFKASVSKAYEGYRKEAVSLDEEFARRLFGSALSRLDELPSRFISASTHSTPLSELMDHPTLKEFIGAFPDAGSKLIAFLSDGKIAAAGVTGAIVGAATKSTTRKASVTTKETQGDADQ